MNKPDPTGPALLLRLHHELRDAGWTYRRDGYRDSLEQTWTRATPFSLTVIVIDWEPVTAVRQISIHTGRPVDHETGNERSVTVMGHDLHEVLRFAEVAGVVRRCGGPWCGAWIPATAYRCERCVGAVRREVA